MIAAALGALALSHILFGTALDEIRLPIRGQRTLYIERCAKLLGNGFSERFYVNNKTMDPQPFFTVFDSSDVVFISWLDQSWLDSIDSTRCNYISSGEMRSEGFAIPDFVIKLLFDFLNECVLHDNGWATPVITNHYFEEGEDEPFVKRLFRITQTYSFEEEFWRFKRGCQFRLKHRGISGNFGRIGTYSSGFVGLGEKVNLNDRDNRENEGKNSQYAGEGGYGIGRRPLPKGFWRFIAYCCAFGTVLGCAASALAIWCGHKNGRQNNQPRSSDNSD
jgi:hypothetical protein